MPALKADLLFWSFACAVLQKKSKKEKRKSVGGEEAADVSMVVEDAPSPEKKSKKDKSEKEEFHVPLDAIAPIAAPLAGKKLSKKLFKTVKKGP
jgi:H/ACA ribonucleoprotein complex subunit 2